MNNDNTMTVTTRVHLRKGSNGEVELRTGMAPQPEPGPELAPRGRVPRVSRVMALAIHFDGLLRRGEVKDLAELARVGHVTRARVTQVMNLLMLAPDIQEQVLFLPPTAEGRDRLREWQLRAVAARPDWAQQRRAWSRL